MNPHLLTSPAISIPESPPTSKRILIVDDHPVYRHGLTALLGGEKDFVICGEAENGAAAILGVKTLEPDVVLVDISLPGENGIEIVKEIHAKWPDIPIVVLSMHDESRYALAALRAGAGGYVIKHEAFLHVIAAIRAVLKEDIYVSPRFRDQLAFKAMSSLNNGLPSPIDKLSDREVEVLRFLGTGFSTREIAATLKLSAKTVETHRAHIKDKLKLRDSNQLVRFAVDWVGQAYGREISPPNNR